MSNKLKSKTSQGKSYSKEVAVPSDSSNGILTNLINKHADQLMSINHSISSIENSMAMLYGGVNLNHPEMPQGSDPKIIANKLEFLNEVTEILAIRLQNIESSLNDII